jgi:lipopolysaccharide transport system ATP-binding protein
MYVRLGFAVAAHMEPDILLVDEVLAVGDAEFQVKCLQRIEELKREGTTSVFISHDLTAVERLCDTAMLLEAGRVAATGLPAEVVGSYHRRLTIGDAASGEPPVVSPETGVAVTNLTLADPDEPRAVSFRTGAPLTISVRYAVDRPVPNAEFELYYVSGDGRTRIAAPRTGERGEALFLKPPGGVVEFTCQAPPLKAGLYYIGAVVRDLTTSKGLAWWDGDTRLYVQSGTRTEGQFYFPHSWRVIHAEEFQGAARRAGGELETSARHSR